MRRFLVVGLDCDLLRRELTPVYDLIPAGDVTEALDLLERKFGIEGVITARQVGHGPGGIELLAVIHRHHPELTRILICHDATLRIPMLELGLAHAVLAIDRQPGELLQTIRFAQRETMTPPAERA
jgi:hypothetical protein